MTSHARGLVLQNTGVIGPQGNTLNRSDNQWTGTWPSSDYHTYVISSNATSSPLSIATSGAPFVPTNNGGAPVTYNAAGAVIMVSGAPYNCPNLGLPTPPQYRQAGETGLVDLASLEAEISIYPNPSSGDLTIHTGSEKEELSVTINDLSGKLVFEKRLNTENYTSAFSLSLENGVYFVTVIKHGTGEKTVKKLVIQN
jgi:hypothetical protein